MFYHEGGVDVGDVDAKGLRMLVGVTQNVTAADIEKNLLTHVCIFNLIHIITF